MLKASMGEAGVERRWAQLAAPGEHSSCSTPTPCKGRSPSTGFSSGHHPAPVAQHLGQKGSTCPKGPSLLQRGGGHPRGMHPCGPRLSLQCRGGGSVAEAMQGVLGCALTLPVPAAAQGSPHCPMSLNPPGSARGHGNAAGRGCWGLWHGEGAWQPSPGPSPELGVVDQGAERSGEGGRFALQLRRAGFGHGLPRGGRWRKAAQAGGRLAGVGRPRGGGRRAVRHGSLLGKPGRQRQGLLGRQPEVERGQRSGKPTLAAETAHSGHLPDRNRTGRQA